MIRLLGEMTRFIRLDEVSAPELAEKGSESDEVKLWLDDVRDPPSDDWTVIRTGREFVRLWFRLYPDVSVVSFDHDLGGELSGSDCAMVVASTLRLMDDMDFKWNIHSANPVGADRMKSELDAWPQWEG